MISKNDSMNTVELKDRYVIVPNSIYLNWEIDYEKYPQAKVCKEGFDYNSENNPDFYCEKLKNFTNSN